MGKENNKFDWKPLRLVVIFCIMIVLPVLPSVGGVHESGVLAAHNEKNIIFRTNQKLTVSSACVAYFKGTSGVKDCRDGEVPLPAATWLFVLALVAFVGLSNKKKV